MSIEVTARQLKSHYVGAQFEIDAAFLQERGLPPGWQPEIVDPGAAALSFREGERWLSLKELAEVQPPEVNLEEHSLDHYLTDNGVAEFDVVTLTDPQLGTIPISKVCIHYRTEGKVIVAENPGAIFARALLADLEAGLLPGIGPAADHDYRADDIQDNEDEPRNDEPNF